MAINSQAQDHFHHAQPGPHLLVSNQSFYESEEDDVGEKSMDGRNLVGELSYMIHGDKPESCRPPAITILNQGDALNDSELLKMATKHLYEKSDTPIFLGSLAHRKTLSSMLWTNLAAGYGDSGYHSGIRQSADGSILEIIYGLRQKGYPRPEGDSPAAFHQCVIVHFRYNLQNGRASYLLACAEDQFQPYVYLLSDDLINAKAGLHPFAIHLVIFYKHCIERGEIIEELLRSLLAVESEYFSPDDDDGNITTQTANETRSRLKELHSLFRNIVIQENNSKGISATLQRLSKDLDRVTALAQSNNGVHNIEPQSHSRIVDGFLYLQDIYQDRATRLSTRKERVQNSVAYTYNLLANRDSQASQRIAEQSALIAHEARQDSAAMRTIAVLTMFFLPATFVSSLLGTNLFALDPTGGGGGGGGGGAPGKPRFVVSELWWVYLVSAVPLTLVTLLCWALYLRWRARRRFR